MEHMLELLKEPEMASYWMVESKELLKVCHWEQQMDSKLECLMESSLEW